MWLLMDHRPDIDWPIVHRIVGLRAPRLPEISRREAHRVVADIRLRAREAGAIAARSLALPPGHATQDIVVVDRQGWADAASRMTEAAFERLGWPSRPDGFRRRALAMIIGAGVGVGFRVGSTRLLGQFDAFSDRRTLYLVAPNILVQERKWGFTPGAFRRWVGIHEQTHAIQFALAPWLPEYMLSLVREADGVGKLQEITALMTFLEGHADYVSDHTGMVRGVKRMRDVFGRETKPRARLHDKRAQYTNGREFCVRVRRKTTRGGMLAAFDRPENLPTRSEIHDPDAWVRRVHGKA